MTVFAATVVPVAHARAERLASARAVEKVHSGTCPRLHDEATCRACVDGTELPPLVITALGDPVEILERPVGRDVSPFLVWRFPGNHTRAPPPR